MSIELKKEFDQYVDNFDKEDFNILRKYHHSYRVMKNAMDLATNIEEYQDNIDVVEVAGLLHDYGRFPQLEMYHTLSDLKSIDHADLGVKLLFEQGDIKKFYNEEKDYSKIQKAIKYHNKYRVPDSLSKQDKVLCNIIRDADKIDILFQFVIGENIIRGFDGIIPEEYKCAFEEERLVKLTEISDSNNILFHLAFVFDITFPYSLKVIKKRKIIPNIYEKIKDKEMYKPYFDKIERYIEKRLIEC